MKWYPRVLRFSCRTIALSYTGDEWVQSHRGMYSQLDPPLAPAWARDVRTVECSDGVVLFWKGDPPDNATSLLLSLPRSSRAQKNEKDKNDQPRTGETDVPPPPPVPRHP